MGLNWGDPQWGCSPSSLDKWTRRYREEGPQGLETRPSGKRGPRPAARTVPKPVREEIVRVQQQHPDFGLRRTATSWRVFVVRGLARARCETCCASTTWSPWVRQSRPHRAVNREQGSLRERRDVETVSGSVSDPTGGGPTRVGGPDGANVDARIWRRFGPERGPPGRDGEFGPDVSRRDRARPSTSTDPRFRHPAPGVAPQG